MSTMHGYVNLVEASLLKKEQFLSSTQNIFTEKLPFSISIAIYDIQVTLDVLQHVCVHSHICSGR